MDVNKKQVVIRPERKDDYENITLVNNKAFGQDDEGILIKKLREDEQFDPRLSLVAEIDGRIIGHILFFPITIENGDHFHDTISLAPMAVVPSLQKMGVGMELIMKGLSELQKLGYESVIVLGHPEYYPKFGFQPASKWNISAPIEYPDNALMALELVKGSLEDKSGKILFPAPFFDAL
jgi:predicted N-acetyltransferase YhbS